MADAETTFWLVTCAYAALSAIFLVSENRSPQSTLAWLLAFLLLPVAGAVLYLLFWQPTTTGATVVPEVLPAGPPAR